MNVRSKGRPVVDQEWNLILKRCSDVLPHEEMDNEHLVEEWQTQGTSPHGCYIRPGQQSKALDKVWLCKMYLAGQQRIIGTGTLHQCARLYDAALFRFAKYRAHERVYNFSEEQARTDNTIESDVVSYLEDLEKLLLARKLLVTQQEKKEVQELRDIDRRHDRTAMGRIESTQHAIIEQIETLKTGLQTISDTIRQTNLTVAAINSRLASHVPVTVEMGGKPEIRGVKGPVGLPEFFRTPTNPQTPIGVKSTKHT
jgi:hypothetical protein